MKTNKPLQTAATQPEPVHGSFECETCGDSVDEADYYAAQQFLVWRCQQGHTTRLENFKF